MKALVLALSLWLIGILSFSQCAKDSGIEVYVPSEEEKQHLKYLREEEYLAGDVYEYFSDLYDIPIFRNISKSEDVHTDRVKLLLKRYQVEDPAINHEKGKYQDSELQKLYDSLIKKGSSSLDSAIVVGLMIEEKDIMDLQHALDNIVKAEDIRAVYTALKRGSANHLRAFNFHAERRNITYTPKFLSNEVFCQVLEK